MTKLVRYDSYRRTASTCAGNSAHTAWKPRSSSVMMNAIRTDSSGRDRLDEGLRGVQIEQDAVAIGHIEIVTGRLDAPTLRSGLQPQQRRNGLESTMMRHRPRRLVGQVEKLDVLLETVGHREFIGELVVALDRLALRRLPVIAALMRGLVMNSQIPSASHSGSPGRRPFSRSTFCSSAETSLLVTLMDWRWPPSCLFRRITGVGGGSGTGKKVQYYRVSFALKKKRRVSSTANNDFGYGNRRRGNQLFYHACSPHAFVGYELEIPNCVVTFFVEE